MENTPGLTTGYPQRMDKLIRQTYPGQAAWAGGGPARKRCNDCQYYGGYMQAGYDDKGDPKYKERRTRCMKYYELMHKAGASIPPHALACHYFLQKQFSE